MDDDGRGFVWTLLCPHHRARAEVTFDPGPGRPAVVRCSLVGRRRRCDEECATWFGGAERPAEPAGPAEEA